MNEQTVRALGFILACNARVEGMKSHNLHVQHVGGSDFYDEQAFFHEAAQMEIIAHELQG